jgi:hypothetical protein
MNAVMQHFLSTAREHLIAFRLRQPEIVRDLSLNVGDTCLAGRRVFQHGQHEGLKVGDRRESSSNPHFWVRDIHRGPLKRLLQPLQARSIKHGGLLPRRREDPRRGAACGALP